MENLTTIIGIFTVVGTAFISVHAINTNTKMIDYSMEQLEIYTLFFF